MRLPHPWLQRLYRWIPSLIAAILALNGMLNIVTGLLVMFKIAAFEPADYVPDYLQLQSVQQTSGIISILLGIFLIFLSKGIHQRRRRSWTWAVALLILLLTNSIMRGTFEQTAVVSLSILVLLVAFYRYFSEASDGISPYSHLLAWGTLLFALAYGIAGSYLMREQFDGMETWTDAVYYTIVTYSTVGYGDVLAQTRDAKIFAVSMIVIGLTSFLTALTVLVGPLIENRVKGVLKIMTKLQNTKNHVIVCGYSAVAEVLMAGLQNQKIPYVVIEKKENVAQNLQQAGHRVMIGDATRLQVLVEAGLANSLALICASPQDAVNLLTAMTAQNYREQTKNAFRIVVRVENQENMAKVKKAGADEVVSPAALAGELMLQKALSQS